MEIVRVLAAKLCVVPALGVALSLGACSDEPGRQPEDALLNDPAIIAALNDPIMIDPDLAMLNEASSALTTGTRSGAIPAHVRSEQVAEAARSEAAALLSKGGGALGAPEPTQTAEPLALATGITLARKGAALPGATECPDAITYTARWAADMPAAFPVYPMGSVEDAAGMTARGCSLRMTQFVTPVARNEVLDFYHTRAQRNGFSVDLASHEDEVQAIGAKGADSFGLLVSELPWGGSRIVLLTLDR